MLVTTADLYKRYKLPQYLMIRCSCPDNVKIYDFCFRKDFVKSKTTYMCFIKNWSEVIANELHFVYFFLMLVQKTVKNGIVKCFEIHINKNKGSKTLVAIHL